MSYKGPVKTEHVDCMIARFLLSVRHLASAAVDWFSVDLSPVSNRSHQALARRNTPNVMSRCDGCSPRNICYRVMQISVFICRCAIRIGDRRMIVGHL